VWLIDGVDEALDRNRHLLDTITAAVEAAPVEHLRHLRLLLFSRPYAELEVFRDRLQGRYAGLTDRTRLPRYWLTRLDRAAAAALVGLDRFAAVVDLIGRNDLRPVAGYPIVLNFLRTYRETDCLSVPDVWRGVLMALLGGPRSNRAVRFATELNDRFAAACRIAAVITLTGRDAIRPWSPDRDEPTLDTLFQTPVGPQLAAAREACESALFTVADPRASRFAQRNTPDWLTAFALADLPRPRLRSALSASDGTLAPRMREAAWLIREVNPASRTVIDQLTGGGLLPSDAFEPTLAEVLRILDHLEELAAASPWGLRVGFEMPEDLARLRVGGLGAILATRLRDPQRPSRVKRLLIDVAETTTAADAVEAAVDLVLDPTQEDELRYDAIWMVALLGGPAHLRALEGPIGQGGGESENECRLRGVLVREFLNRGMWPPWQVVLNAPRVNPDLADSRYMIFQWVLQRMTVEDARHLLPHLGELFRRHADEHRPDVLPQFLARAVELVLREPPPAPGDIEALCGFVAEVAGDPHGWSVAHEVAERLRPYTSARRRLYRHDIGAAGDRQILAWQFLEPQDWRWLRDQALTEWPGNQEDWGHALWLAVRAREGGHLDEDEWGEFVQLVERNVPGLPAEFDAQRRRFEQERAEREAARRERAARDPARRPLAEQVQRLLDRPGLPAPDLMRQLGRICFVDRPAAHPGAPGGWIDLPAELRRRVLDACCRGLESGEPTLIPPSGSYPVSILAKGAAFAQVVGSSDHAAWLTDRMIRSWLPTALFAQRSGDWDGLIAACDAVSGPATESALLNTITLHVCRDDRLFDLRRIPAAWWTDAMTGRLAELVSDGTVPPPARAELLGQLAQRSPERAEPVAAAWATRPVAADEGDHLRQAGLNVLLARNPARALDLIEAGVATRGAAALEELPVLWGRHDWRAVRVEEWPLVQVERLAGLLLQAYPVAPDPEIPDGFVTPADELRQLRDQLVRVLMENDDEQAQTVLDRLAAFDPQVRARVLTFRANQRAAQFLPGVDPSAARDPAALSMRNAVQLLDRADFRLIRSPADLLDAVLEALRQIDVTVGHDLPMLYSAPDSSRSRNHLHEDALQAYLRRRLLDELSRVADGVEVHIAREDQVARRQRLDLRVVTPRHGGTGLAQVVVEVKWSTNEETRSGLVDQLGNRYLLGEGLTHGVFAVGWSGGWYPRDGSGWNTDLARLVAYLTTQRDGYCQDGQPGASLRIQPFVLDARWSRTNQ
jgi:hypothetical protein